MIPIFKAIFDPEDVTEGVFVVSLVTDPAVESLFLAFDKDEVQKFSVVDDEEHKVLGCVLRADYPILRVDGQGNYYNIVFDKETIYNLTKSFLDRSDLHAVSVQHNGVQVEGVSIVQLFIKDSAKGISPIGFDDVEDGSLFAEYKIDNPEVWDAIKRGEYRGFSVEGVFGLKQSDNFNKHNIFNMSSLRDKIAKFLLKFESIVTDKGEIFYDAEVLEAGTEVYLYDENGDRAVPEDGEYAAEDKVIVVEEGKVKEIKELEAPKDEEPADEPVEMEEQPAEEPAEPEVKDELPPVPPEIEELKAIVADLDARLKAIEEKLAEPVVEEVQEVFSKYTKTDSTALGQKLNSIGNALRHN